MSTFGWSNISGIDDDSGATPGGINGSVQFNDNGINFAGVSDFTYNDATKTLNVTKILATNITGTYIKPITLVDAGGNYGANGQVLKSNGLTTVWSNDAAGNDRYVQYNRTGMLAGDIGFQYDEALQNLQVSSITTNTIRPGDIEDSTLSTGSNGQYLTNNGTLGSSLVWADLPPFPTPSAPTNSIQFNNGGVFGGSANLIFDPATSNVNVNGNVGIGSLSAPAHRLQVTGSNTTINGTSNTGLSTLLLTDTSAPASQKQFSFILNGPSNTGDIISIQQGAQFRPIRLNPGASTGQTRVSIGTTLANAQLQLNNELVNRKIVLHEVTNNDHQYLGLGINTNTFRYQIASSADSHVWFAGTSGSTSVELMRLSGTGSLGIGGLSGTLLTISKAALGSAAPITVPTGTYLKLGGSEFRSGTSNPNYRLIGFGFNTGTNNQPAYMGYIETNGSGQSNGALVFGTRPDHTVDAIPTERMRISPAGNVSIGNTNNTFPLEVTGTIRSTSIRPDSILDVGNSAGVSQQILSSTTTGIQWVNHARGPAYAVQFNSGTGVNPVMNGTSNLTWTGPISNTLTVNGTALIDVLQANNQQIVYNLAVGTLTAAVPRIFAQSGSAPFGLTSWDDQWIMAGAGGTGTSAGIGMGYNTAGNFGVIFCGEPTISNKPIIYSAGGHEFKVNLSTRMTITNTPGGDGLVTTHTLQATQIRDGFLNTGTNGQVLTSTGIGLLWDELTPRYFFDSNATFQGTSGHRIYVSIQKKNTLYSVQVSMQRDGGIHFDLVSPALTVGTQIIATLPVGWRPPASVDGIGYASNNNTWASQAFNWGSLNIDTSGNIRMRSPASGGPITSIQPNLEQITCNIFWLSSGTVYNSDGITR